MRKLRTLNSGRWGEEVLMERYIIVSGIETTIKAIWCEPRSKDPFLDQVILPDGTSMIPLQLIPNPTLEITGEPTINTGTLYSECLQAYTRPRSTAKVFVEMFDYLDENDKKILDIAKVENKLKSVVLEKLLEKRYQIKRSDLVTKIQRITYKMTSGNYSD